MIMMIMDMVVDAGVETPFITIIFHIDPQTGMLTVMGP
jgi:hypothetical protein